MRTPEEVADDIHEELVVPSKTANLIRDRDKEVRLAMLNRLYEMYDGVPETGWALDHLRAEIEADNV